MIESETANPLGGEATGTAHDLIEAYTLVIAALAGDSRTYDDIRKNTGDLTEALVRVAGSLLFSAHTSLVDTLARGGPEVAFSREARD